MAESLTVTTLWLYRQERAERDPQDALEAVRTHVRIAKMYATADARWALVAKLSGEESNLTHWLQCVRIRGERAGRSGRYWLTGQLSSPLRYTIQASYGDGHSTDLIECTSPGCAIKHALALFADELVRHVFITANRFGVGYTIGRDATMATLAELAWPVN